jgi:hypothetical protein
MSAQNRSISEGAVGGSVLSPAIVATQPQSLALNFSVTPNTTFGIQSSTGLLFLQPTAVLNFLATNVYSLTVIAVSSAGTQASALITVFITQVNRPPIFASSAYNASINEGATGQSFVTTITATTTNIVDQLTYSIADANPKGALSWFVVDTLLGIVSVSAGIPGGALMYDRSLVYPALWTVNVTLRATNQAGQSTNTSVAITIARIAPRVILLPYLNATVAQNATFNVSVLPGGMSSAVWAPYGVSRLSYSLMSGITTDRGLPAFYMPDALTGAVRVADVSYVNSQTGVTVNGPAFNVNIQPWISSTWTVTDGSTGLSATGLLNVTISLSNRAPWWAWPDLVGQTVFYAQQNKVAPVGSPVSPAVQDLDLALGIGRSRVVCCVLSLICRISLRSWCLQAKG